MKANPQLDELIELERPYFDDYPEFEPFGSPRELLELGIFNGEYFNDCPHDIPKHWLISSGYYFGKKASKSRQWWIDRGLITPHDPLGWFQWYLNFYNGRRVSVDQWQIDRWRKFNARHGKQVELHGNGDLMKQNGRRQALLHWACNPAPDCIS